VQTHKLPGGATGSSFEQAQKGGFLDRMPEILQNELPRVQVELGNFWSVTPGSQILWTTAANNIVKGVRYKDASDDLKNLLLERYGKFPFYKPAPEIYEAVFGKDWKKIVRNEAGYQKIEDVDLDIEKDCSNMPSAAKPPRTNWCCTCSIPTTRRASSSSRKNSERPGCCAQSVA